MFKILLIIIFFFFYNLINSQSLNSFVNIESINHCSKLKKYKKDYKKDFNYLLNNKDEILQLKSNLFGKKEYSVIYLYSNESFVAHAVLTESVLEKPQKKIMINPAFNQIIIYDFINDNVFMISSLESLGNIWFKTKSNVTALYNKSNYNNKIFLLNEDFSPKALIKFDSTLNLFLYKKGKILKTKIDCNFQNVFEIPLQEVSKIFSGKSESNFEEIKCAKEDCFEETKETIWMDLLLPQRN